MKKLVNGKRVEIKETRKSLVEGKYVDVEGKEVKEKKKTSSAVKSK